MASFTCATPLSTRAPPFVPRRASPFDASTSNCRQDSDCGSSSGLGGMKTQELASDEGGSSSSGAQGPYSLGPPPFLPRPNGLPLHCMPPPLTLPQGLPPWVHPTPPGASNDLFVHVQSGETLSVCIGTEMKNINGPATVRMVGESGISPTALPIQVPPGHIIHQICDDQGILRHLILSPERPLPYPPSVATPSSGCSRLVSPPLASLHTPFYTVNRKWSHHGKTAVYADGHDESPDGDIDSDEAEKVREMLNRIQAPLISRVTATEADIQWHELDTSEAAAPGGPFPQIDASEFAYYINLFEGQGRYINTYPCDSDQGNQMRLCQLRPNTDYFVQLKATLNERDLIGEPSQPVCFKTAPYKPEAPLLPKVLSKGTDWANIHWRHPNDNGAPITSYTVYVEKFGEGDVKKAWEGKMTEARLQGLIPATCYHIRVTAWNCLGEGPETSPIVLSTRTDGPPPQPQAPGIVNVNKNGVKLAWTNIPEFSYSIEQHDVVNDIYSMAKERLSTGNVFIADLIPGDYRFRLQAHNNEGDSPKSEWTVFKMTGKPLERPLPMNERVIIPSKPFIVGQHKRKTEIGWKCIGGKDREFIFHVEGSTYNHPSKFRTLYKGNQTTYLITEEDIQNIRVQSITKKGLTSDYSEMLVLPRPDEDIARPAMPSAPSLEPSGRGALLATWSMPKTTVPPTASLMFELRRIDGKPHIVYSGAEESFLVNGLTTMQHVEVQVRAVIVTRSGTRFEGDWSAVVGGTAPKEPPRPPRDLRLASDMSHITWSAPETSVDLRYRVHCCEVVDRKTVEERLHETSECRHPLSKLAHAKNYVCRVIAFHDADESEWSEDLKFVTPPGVPAQPESVSIEADSTNALTLKWTAPDCRGDPIQQYRIRIESRGEVVRESSVLLPSVSSCEYRISDLSPDTSYRVEISAQNTVGSGVSAAISGRTRCLPPSPPRLDAEAEPNVLKLKWKPPATHNFMTYRLVRLVDNDNHEVIYEGEQCTYKLRSLSENTEYRFQIRSSDRQTGAGPWSEIYCFTTLLAPPPTVKSSPTATACGNGYYQVEWTSIISKPNSRKTFYRLQAVDCSIENAKWHTVYDGPMTSFSLRVSDYPSAVQARVMCVRPRDDGGEILGTPSPVVYIANNPVDRRESQSPMEIAPTLIRPRFTWLKLRSDHSITILSVLGFVVVSCIIAIICDVIVNRVDPKP